MALHGRSGMASPNDSGKMIPADRPQILFGAFDRHNFGDLLLGETARMLMSPDPVVFAGLADRDLSACGGERVRAITALAKEWCDCPAEVLHVGGELLTCTLYEAAVMLQSDEEAQRAMGRHETDPDGGYIWAARYLGLDQAIAYQVSRRLFRSSGFFGYLGVGGMELDRLPDEVRRHVISRLDEADHVWVRDRETHRQLAIAGVSAQLAPDPVELSAILFGSVVEERPFSGQQRAIHERYPSGYLAVQFSADFGDDATLEIIGRQLQQIRQENGLGIVLFRAGAAPWHDRPEVYRRLQQRMADPEATVFDSLNILDICTLLARSRGYLGSSLHARIVAEAFGHPAVSLVQKAGERSKSGSYVASWRPDALGTVVSPEKMAAAWDGAMAIEPANRQQERLVIAAANAVRQARGLAPLRQLAA